jgi:L-ascorbate metabolism protein UlaG (beta-lactamase superfamily)
MTLRVTWLGHATLVIDVDGTRILTDPLLGPHNRPLRRRGPAPRRDQWSGADAVLISHLHHDHAELSSLRLLDHTPVLTAAQNATFLRRRGVPGAVGLDGGWHTLPGTTVEVRLTRADHGHRPMPHRPNAANGHLIRTSRARIWVAGDTSLFDELADVPEQAGGPIDLAVVPVGGWGARLSGGHLDGDRAAQACALVGARNAMPYHFGTLYVPGTRGHPRGWMDAPATLFREALPRHAPACRGVVLTPGTTVEMEI